MLKETKEQKNKKLYTQKEGYVTRNYKKCQQISIWSGSELKKKVLYEVKAAGSHVASSVLFYPLTYTPQNAHLLAKTY